LVLKRDHHLVTTHIWKLEPGRRELRLRVPRRARQGRYLLRVTARDRHGHAKRFERDVRLRR
jgi:hypothetical protein